MVQVNWFLSKFARSAFQKKMLSLGISLFGLCLNVRQAVTIVANMWNCWTFLVVVWLSQRQGSSFYIFSSRFKMLIRYNATAFFLHKRGRLEINDSRHFESLRPTALALIWKSLIFVIYMRKVIAKVYFVFNGVWVIIHSHFIRAGRMWLFYFK